MGIFGGRRVAVSLLSLIVDHCAHNTCCKWFVHELIVVYVYANIFVDNIHQTKVTASVVLYDADYNPTYTLTDLVLEYRKPHDSNNDGIDDSLLFWAYSFYIEEENEIGSGTNCEITSIDW